MWLIDTTTITLKSVPGPGPENPYAILSHTWTGDNEVTFQDFISLERDIHHPRFCKITQTCRLALEQGIPYTWVDSCCIDKTSSAELTEAINSMFHWYKESAVCFTYLADWEVDGTEADLGKCRWFKRGWTLQELVASPNIVFYDAGWNRRGDKRSLSKLLSFISSIDPSVLEHSENLMSCSVAKRMSWAAERQTTREEDMAYCLFGIFDVYLPLIYGERGNAFIRLQEAILRETNDLSLLAWTDQDEEWKRQKYRGLFAHSPKEFIRCGMISNDSLLISPPECTLTNRGLRLVVSLKEGEVDSERGDLRKEKDFLLNLHCRRGETYSPDNFSGQWFFIRVVETPYGYVRHHANIIEILRDRILDLDQQKKREIYLLKTIAPAPYIKLARELSGDSFHIAINNQTDVACSIVRQLPQQLWNTREECFKLLGQQGKLYVMLELSLSSCERGTLSAVAAKNQPNEQLYWPNVYLIVHFQRGSYVSAKFVPKDSMIQDGIDQVVSDFKRSNQRTSSRRPVTHVLPFVMRGGIREKLKESAVRLSFVEECERITLAGRCVHKYRSTLRLENA